MRFGLLLVRLNPTGWEEAVAVADEVGFESVWIADHLVFPDRFEGTLHGDDDHAPVDPSTPVFDVPAMLSYLAARTQSIRLGVYVYLFGIRHPFIAARGFATLDVVSGGRCELGVGSGWLRNEWRAAGLDPGARGRRLDEALAVARRLWTEPVVEHHGAFFDFEAVRFEPKPVQRPHPPVSVGGESERAMRRAVRWDGWMGLVHTPATAAPLVARYRELEAQLRPGHRGLVTVCGEVADEADLAAWQACGVDRLIVAPWRRSREAPGAIRRFADRFIGAR